jgi:cell division protein FtsB
LNFAVDGSAEPDRSDAASRRSASPRPDPRARSRAWGITGRRRRAGGALTGRALVLGVVVVLMALVLASPLQRFLQQQHALTQAEQQHGATARHVLELQAQLNQWKDPAYIERQARARLQYARPGDTVYVVVDPKKANPDAARQQKAPVTTTAGPSSWQTRAWTTLRVADAAP